MTMYTGPVRDREGRYATPWGARPRTADLWEAPLERGGGFWGLTFAWLAANVLRGAWWVVRETVTMLARLSWWLTCAAGRGVRWAWRAWRGTRPQYATAEERDLARKQARADREFRRSLRRATWAMRWEEFREHLARLLATFGLATRDDEPADEWTPPPADLAAEERRPHVRYRAVVEGKALRMQAGVAYGSGEPATWHLLPHDMEGASTAVLTGWIAERESVNSPTTADN